MRLLRLDQPALPTGIRWQDVQPVREAPCTIYEHMFDVKVTPFRQNPCRRGGEMSVQEQVQAVVDEVPGTVGVYARNLGTDQTVEINADRVMSAESSAKVFILLSYRQLVASGACDPTQRIELTDDDRYWAPACCATSRPACVRPSTTSRD